MEALLGTCERIEDSPIRAAGNVFTEIVLGTVEHPAGTGDGESMTRSRRPRRPSIHWPPIIEQAAEIVRSYDTGVTLRQLFYQLVSEGLIPNVQTAYSRLSHLTAE